MLCLRKKNIAVEMKGRKQWSHLIPLRVAAFWNLCFLALATLGSVDLDFCHPKWQMPPPGGTERVQLNYKSHGYPGSFIPSQGIACKKQSYCLTGTIGSASQQCT
jgi:hypothetical protein